MAKEIREKYQTKLRGQRGVWKLMLWSGVVWTGTEISVIDITSNIKLLETQLNHLLFVNF